MPLALPEELIIGIPQLDDQHRAFYDQLNQLHDAMRDHRLEEVVATADFLAQYARQHFAAEEQLMVEAGYAGFPEHQTRHSEFKKDLQSWRARLAKDGPSAALVVELSGWLTTWLREHIRKVDGPLARFLRERAKTGR